MKKIYLLMIIVMFLLFIKGVNGGAFLGCCVKTLDEHYCRVTEKGGCIEEFWKEGKNIGTSACKNDVSECEKGCCVINGKGFDGNSAYYKQNCIDEKGQFNSGDCSSDTKDEIACILEGGECIWGLTSKQCENKNGEVDESLDEKKCKDKTKENEGNKRCCKSDCEYKFGYECDGTTGDRGVVCAEVNECMNRCFLKEKECRNKDEKELGAEIIQRDNCNGIKYGVVFCNVAEFCLNGKCKSANCGDKSPGWKECVKKGINPGDNDYYRQCYFGDITIESCDSFRIEVCKNTEEEMAPGQAFEGVDCYENDWQHCFDYSGSNKNDCKAKGDCEIIDGQCLPKYPPGFEFWLGDKGKNFKSDKMCISSYDDNKCVRSGDCEGGSGVVTASTGMPNDCGYVCCMNGDETGGVIRKEEDCDIGGIFQIAKTVRNMVGPVEDQYSNLEGYGCNGILGQVLNLIIQFDCPQDVELSGDGYCKCKDTICKKSRGGICKISYENPVEVEKSLPTDCGYVCCGDNKVWITSLSLYGGDIKKAENCNEDYLRFVIVSTDKSLCGIAYNQEEGILAPDCSTDFEGVYCKKGNEICKTS